MKKTNPYRFVFCMAGVDGFEPSHAGFRDQCLTAWRYPNDETNLL